MTFSKKHLIAVCISMAGPFDQWVSENSHCIRGWLFARFAKHFKRGIDSEYVDVFHAKQFAFFCPIRLTK